MSEQIIIAISGRKNAGKNTLATFLSDYYCKKYYTGTLNKSEVVFQCAFADKLKEFCMDTLGLEWRQCSGSDEDKSSPTKYLWDNTSDNLRWKFAKRYDSFVIKKRSGPMSGREVMQVFGTELIRETFGNVWAKATIRGIKRKGKSLSIIDDNRFPNEIDVVLSEPRGHIIRLMRSPFGMKDGHASESSLDHYEWNRERCYVLDNRDMNIEEQNEASKSILDEIFKVE